MSPTPKTAKAVNHSPWLKTANVAPPLSAAESKILAALPSGVEVDVRDSDDNLAPIRANVIRAIVGGLAIPADQIDPRGLRLKGALFEERLDLDDTEFTRPLVFSNCTFSGGLSAERAHLHAVDFDHSIITAPNQNTAAVAFDEIRISHGLSLTACDVTGAIGLLGAHIGGQLDFDGGTFTNNAGSAVEADGLTASSNVSLAGTFSGNGERGTVRLLGANIGGQLQCQRGTFTNNAGPALHADNLTAIDHVFLAGTFIGDGERGAVRLLGAHVGGQLQCDEGTFTNNTGPALLADNLTTTSSVRLTGAFIGGGDRGTVCLPGANLGGQLSCVAPGTISSDGPGALFLEGCTIKGTWLLEPSFRASETSMEWLSLDGLTYQGLPLRAGDAAEWSHILSEQTTEYAAQPWQQLAAAYRAAGHQQEAKTILIAQQDDRRRRVVQATGQRWRSALMGASKLFTGYGYQSYRALGWLLTLAVIGVVAALWAGNVKIDANTDPASPPAFSTVLAHKPTKTSPGEHCSKVELVGVGIDWAVPVLSTKAGETCVLNSAHPVGQLWTAGSWALRLAGWALATLAVAGYTGLVRRL